MDDLGGWNEVWARWGRLGAINPGYDLGLYWSLVDGTLGRVRKSGFDPVSDIDVITNCVSFNPVLMRNELVVKLMTPMTYGGVSDVDISRKVRTIRSLSEMFGCAPWPLDPDYFSRDRAPDLSKFFV